MAVDIFGEEVPEEEEKEADLLPSSKEPALFDILNDICIHKKGIVNRDNMKGYNPFVTSQALSQHMDTVLLANELNKNAVTDPLMHYDYLMSTVKPKKRYGKWAKPEQKDEETITLLAHHFEVSKTQAEEYMNIITRDELDNIKQQYNEGGKKNGNNNKRVRI